MKESGRRKAQKVGDLLFRRQFFFCLELRILMGRQSYRVVKVKRILRRMNASCHTAANNKNECIFALKYETETYGRLQPDFDLAEFYLVLEVFHSF